MNGKNSAVPVKNLLVYLNLQNALFRNFNSLFTNGLPEKIFEKVEQVINKGDKALTAYWIDSGYGRAYQKLVDKEGLPIEVTIDFYKPQRILVAPESFFNGLPCNYFVEVAKGSVIVEFTRTSFDALKLVAPQLEALANNILANEKPDNLEKMGMLKMKGEQKYNEFIRIFGINIEQHFAQKHIASYLGFTPEYLSAVKAGRFY